MFSTTINSLKSIIDGYKEILPEEMLDSSEELSFVTQISNELNSKFAELFGDSIKLEIDRGRSNNYVGLYFIKESNHLKFSLFGFSKYKNNKYVLHHNDYRKNNKQVSLIRLKKLIIECIAKQLKSEHFKDRLMQ